MDEADRPDRRDPGAGRTGQPEQVRDQRSAAPLSAGPAIPPGPAGFPFAQLEVPWPLGPPDGRYVLRDPVADVVTHVAVLETLGAPRRPGRLQRTRSRPSAPEPEPAPVTTGRATIVDVRGAFDNLDGAREWLAGAGEPALTEALVALNRVLHAHRLVAADPHQGTVARERLIAARVGYGTGEQVADGRYAQARELPEPTSPGGRRRALAPQARLAAVLGGRVQALACEELVLRARADLDTARPREAALQALVALDAALAELSADPHAAALADRLQALRGRREATGAAAQAALTATPGGPAIEDVELTVTRLEAALRARAAARDPSG